MDKVGAADFYAEDIESVLKLDCDWNNFRGKTFLISGATGLIGTPLVDMLVFLNEKFSLDLKLILLSRHKKESDREFIRYIAQNVCQPFDIDGRIDFIVHAASNTHPLQYSEFPVETVETNVFGSYNLLKIAEKNKGSRFLLVSSVEVYGDDRTGLEKGFGEKDFGYLDCNLPRSCYNESKRLCETLCASFSAEKKIDYVIARLCRCYGPTLKKDDSKALSQFLKNAVRGENIVLKSEGNQYYSYIYSSDAAAALLLLLLKGAGGEAYNVSDEKSNVTLKSLAEKIARCSNLQVIFDLPGETEKKGFSRAQTAILNSSKIKALGWRANFDIDGGIRRTLSFLKSSL